MVTFVEYLTQRLTHLDQKILNTERISCTLQEKLESARNLRTQYRCAYAHLEKLEKQLQDEEEREPFILQMVEVGRQRGEASSQYLNYLFQHCDLQRKNVELNALKRVVIRKLEYEQSQANSQDKPA